MKESRTPQADFISPAPVEVVIDRIVSVLRDEVASNRQFRMKLALALRDLGQPVDDSIDDDWATTWGRHFFDGRRT